MNQSEESDALMRQRRARYAVPRPSDNHPIFVVGAPRSGTTLLYHLLIGSRAFPVYMAESKVMACAGHYGRLTGKNRERFLRDYLRSRQFLRSGLDASEFSKLVSRQARLDYTGFLRILMDAIARAQGKYRWVEKTPAHVWHMDRLAATFDQGKFIHIVRDGRDVALSLRRLGWTHAFGENEALQLVEGAKRWEASVLHGCHVGRSLGERYLEIRYEDLVTSPEVAMRRVGEFAGFTVTMSPPESEIADSIQSANTAFSSPMHGISDEAVRRWEKRLKTEELVALDHVIGPTLDELGYPRSGVEGKPEPAVRMFARILPLMERAGRILKSKTPLRRMTESPLEIGLA